MSHTSAGVVQEGEAIVGASLEDMDRPGRQGYMGTPETLLQQTLVVSQALDKFKAGFEKFEENNEDAEELICSVCPLAHVVSQLMAAGKGVSQVSPNIELGDELASACRLLGTESLALLKSLKTEGGGAACGNEMRARLDAVHASLEAVARASGGLSNSLGEADTQKLGDLLEDELAQMDRAIDEAAQRIQDMLNKSREGDSGIKLEVNSKILDACTGLMQAIRELVKSSKHLQEEIVAKEKGSASKKEFYSRNHRWTEGLISAAKVVGLGAKFLVDAADRVVSSGGGKFEELVVASQEIAGATAQLVVASRVKADRGSARLAALGAASKGVSQATGNVVATAKACAHLVEDSEVLDFSRITLHQAKRLEMESQVRVLELESSLERERVQLAALRKRHYHLAGASEGWDDAPELFSVAILRVLCRVASRSGYLRHRILCSRCHGSAICAIAGARWCEEAWEVYDPDDGEESCHNQANREWTFAARCRWMTVDAGWRSSLSSDDNDDRPQPSEIANAVTILSSVYSDDVTLAQIRANQIASKRSLRQGSIKDFF
ncbi:hypothetical protein HPB51_004134 [Rhipicephalus microplus]|uniref:I/LWEQ domain-containing protein n=1 Tax=Rhipicephalus microplus TaxID=6941 RepID=A0A9J6EWQ5_RHIMP|nr:hypothetical protein HPB51_004134 [Rhipicephalus microplus]